MALHSSRIASRIRGTSAVWSAGLAILLLASNPLVAARGMKPLEMKERYLGVLGTLATGDLDSAIAELMEFEQAATGSQQAWRYVDNLWRAKLHVIRDLLTPQSPDLLMPIIVMHHDAYFRYAEMERNHLAQHSRTMAAELAQVYADRSPSPEAPVFSGWVLASFGTYLWSPSNIGESARLFYEAHLIDPGNPLALRGLATAWERNGDYEKAIEYLNKALRLEPGDPELSLRLALCHLRFPEGKQTRAMQELQRLARSDAPMWVRSVAFQEIARAYLSVDEAEEAESTLREGLKEISGDQQLSLQLASILDEQRRRSEANKVLGEMAIYGWERDSSREIYDFWEPPDLASAREAVHEEMRSGFGALGASLAAGAAGGSGG